MWEGATEKHEQSKSSLAVHKDCPFLHTNPFLVSLGQTSLSEQALSTQSHFNTHFTHTRCTFITSILTHCCVTKPLTHPSPHLSDSLGLAGTGNFTVTSLFNGNQSVLPNPDALYMKTFIISMSYVFYFRKKGGLWRQFNLKQNTVVFFNQTMPLHFGLDSSICFPRAARTPHQRKLLILDLTFSL